MTRPRSSDQSLFRFCPRCATPLERTHRHGATRAVCPACAWVQFRNPVVGVAAVIEEADVASLLGADAIRDATGTRSSPATAAS